VRLSDLAYILIVKLYFFIRDIKTQERRLGRPQDRPQTTHEILFILHGKAKWIYDNREETLGAGDVVFNPEGKLLSEKGVGLYQLLFDESLFSSKVHMEREALYVLGIIKLYAKNGTAIRLSKIGKERSSNIFTNMVWEFQNRYRGYSWAIRLKLIEFLITIMRDKRFSLPVRGLKPLTNNQIQDILVFMEMEYMNPIQVSDILELFPLSRSHFHALFKQETGTTFLDYLTELRCTKAAELLLSTELPIVEVAERCGFGNISHFYHQFKKSKGIPPRQYRLDHESHI
jgi:AraC-like DNA-binding protein